MRNLGFDTVSQSIHTYSIQDTDNPEYSSSAQQGKPQSPDISMSATVTALEGCVGKSAPATQVHVCVYTHTCAHPHPTYTYLIHTAHIQSHTETHMHAHHTQIHTTESHTHTHNYSHSLSHTHTTPPQEALFFSPPTRGRHPLSTPPHTRMVHTQRHTHIQTHGHT